MVGLAHQGPSLLTRCVVCWRRLKKNLCAWLPEPGHVALCNSGVQPRRDNSLSHGVCGSSLVLMIGDRAPPCGLLMTSIHLADLAVFQVIVLI